MPKSTGLCIVCEKSSTLRCSACNSTHYCGKEHQKQDWSKHKALCRCYEVKTTADGDFYVVATRAIKRGAVIIDETPLVIGPYYFSHSEHVCPGCHHQGQRFVQRCPSCEWPVCSIKCPGLTDVTRHGAECSVLSKVKTSVVIRSSDVILPLRCLLLQKTDPKKWKAFLEMALQAVDLGTNTSSNEVKYLLQQTILKPLAKVAPRFLSDCSDHTVDQIFSVLNAYGVDIEAPQYAHMVAVCKVTGCMEHSCLPNTRRLINIPPLDPSRPSERKLQCRVVIRATEDIAKGENISTLFMDTWMCTWARQVSLASSRKTHCRCRRCLDPTELGTNFGTLRCTNGLCTGWVLPLNTLQIDFSRWKCQKCGKIYDYSYVYGLLTSLKNEMSGCRDKEVQNVETYEKMLKKLEISMHPGHHFCLLMKERLFNLHGKSLMEGGGKGLSDVQLERATDLCREVLSVMTNPAIVTQVSKTHECLIVLATLTREMAKRRKASGKWDSNRVQKAEVECEKMVTQAVWLQQANFDQRSAEDRLPIELIQSMTLSIWNNLKRE